MHWKPCWTRSPPTKRKTEAIKKKIKKALFYPAAVHRGCGTIVTTILLIFVIPEFENLFQGFGADLPSFHPHRDQPVCSSCAAQGVFLAHGYRGGTIGGYIWLKKRSQTHAR